MCSMCVGCGLVYWLCVGVHGLLVCVWNCLCVSCGGFCVYCVYCVLVFVCVGVWCVLCAVRGLECYVAGCVLGRWCMLVLVVYVSVFGSMRWCL